MVTNQIIEAISQRVAQIKEKHRKQMEEERDEVVAPYIVEILTSVKDLNERGGNRVDVNYELINILREIGLDEFVEHIVEWQEHTNEEYEYDKLNLHRIEGFLKGYYLKEKQQSSILTSDDKKS